MKVLVVDDSSVIRDALVELIADLEAVETIKEAKDGLEALADFKALRPDIIILDIHMPGLNGIQLLEKIKQTAIPVVVIVFTNYLYPQYRRKCLALGADYFFYKSTECDEMLALLGQLATDEKHQ